VTQEIKQEPHRTVTSERGSRRGGPRTPQGKARSKFNAVRTGIFAKVLLTGDPPGKSHSAYRELIAELQESIRPRDRFEEMLVETLALQFLRLTRVYEADAAVAPILFRNVREKLESDGFEARTGDTLREEPFGAGKLPAADLLMRYEAGIWRHIDRIMDRLDRWRRAHDDCAGRQSGDPG
jgi:hypothetical protein